MRKLFSNINFLFCTVLALESFAVITVILGNVNGYTMAAAVTGALLFYRFLLLINKNL